MQFDPNQLAALAAVLRRGAFDAAAAELNVTPSAISQRIKALEERVGSTLINRGPPCTATPHGARLAKHAQDITLLEQHLAQEMSLDTSGRNHIRIAVNADSLATWFIPVMAAMPDMLFDLVVDDQDHSADWLRRGDVAAAVTATPSLPGCDSYALGSLRYLATASPGYMDRWMPSGPTSAAVAVAPCLTYNQKDQLQRMWIEQTLETRVSPPPHMIPSTHAFVEAAMAGMGWGMNPEPLCRRALRHNRLVCLKENTPLDIALNWQVSRVLAPALQPLTKVVRETAKGVLLPPEA